MSAPEKPPYEIVDWNCLIQGDPPCEPGVHYNFFHNNLDTYGMWEMLKLRKLQRIKQAKKNYDEARRTLIRLGRADLL